jgi:hypothetical protein
MSRYSDQTEHEREYNRRLVEDAPPLTEYQKAVIRAAFTGSDLKRTTG